MDTKPQHIIFKLSPHVEIEKGVEPNDYLDRRKEAESHPRTTQFFIGLCYKLEVITIKSHDARKHELGIFIGPSPQFCDIVISDNTGSEKESPAWGLITYDVQNKLIYRDVRHPHTNLIDATNDEENGIEVQNNSDGTGSGVAIGGKLEEKYKRRRYTWVLSGSEFLTSTRPEVTIHLNDYIRLVVDVPDSDRFTKERVESFHNAPSIYKIGDPESSEFEKTLCLRQSDLKQNVSPSCRHREGDDIILKENIGKGSYGTVRRHYNVSTGICTAVKKPRYSTNQRVREYAEKEIELFKKIQEFSNKDELSKDYSRYIIKYIRSKTGPQVKLELEYASYGTLKYQHDKRRMTLLESVSALEQMLKAISFLHRFDIAHRDIKPANVLVKYRSRLYQKSSDIRIRLADFGMSKIGNHETRAVGTSRYNAPELFGNSPYTTPVDIWSTGVMFYDVYFGLAHGICSLAESVTSRVYASAGVAMCVEIEKAVDKTARAPTPDAYLASFLRDNMVRVNPEQRLSADACLEKIGELRKAVEAFEPTNDAYPSVMAAGLESTARGTGSRTTRTAQTASMASTASTSHNARQHSNRELMRSNDVAHAVGHDLPTPFESGRPPHSNTSSIDMEDVFSDYVNVNESVEARDRDGFVFVPHVNGSM